MKNSGLPFLFLFSLISAGGKDRGVALGLSKRKTHARGENCRLGLSILAQLMCTFGTCLVAGYGLSWAHFTFGFIDLNWQITFILSHDLLTHIFNLSIWLFFALIKYLCIFAAIVYFVHVHVLLLLGIFAYFDFGLLYILFVCFYTFLSSAHLTYYYV